MYYRRAVFS